MAELPTGYALRAPATRDAALIADVIQAHDIADFGEPDFTEGDLVDDWMRPRFVLESDAWVLTGPTGRIIGYAYVWEMQPDRELVGDAFVLPEYAGRGLGSQLLDLIEHRAAEVCAGRAIDPNRRAGDALHQDPHDPPTPLDAAAVLAKSAGDAGIGPKPCT